MVEGPPLAARAAAHRRRRKLLDYLKSRNSAAQLHLVMTAPWRVWPVSELPRWQRLTWPCSVAQLRLRIANSALTKKKLSFLFYDSSNK